MKKALKCQFHAHSAGDPLDYIRYGPKKLIDEAARLNYDVLSITCHRKIIFSKKLAKYAKKRDILLLPGIEFEINGRHILCINTSPEIEKVQTYSDLAAYRASHPDSIIIAPHPYFPGPTALSRDEKDFIKNIQLFDAIEHSFCYTKTRNYNTPAIALAKRWKKPLIATSDCHILSQLNLGYCVIESHPDAAKIARAIRAGKVWNKSAPLSYFRLIPIVAAMLLGYYAKQILKRK